MVEIHGLWESDLQTVVVLVHDYVKTTFRRFQQRATKASQEFTNSKAQNLQMVTPHNSSTI